MGKSLLDTSCKKCGGPRERDRLGRLNCKPCRSAKLITRREELKEQGFCCTCGQVSVVGTGHVYCVDCRIRKREGEKRARVERSLYGCRNCGADLESNVIKHCEKCLAKFRERKVTARAKGLCSHCGKRSVSVGYMTCEYCRDVKKALKAKRVAAGLCGYGSDCQNPHETGKMYCEFHAKRQLKRTAVRRRQQRESIIAAYGGCCACCGETSYEFLAIDHVNGGGKGEGGSPLMMRVIAEGFPSTFRMLCHNCNMARGLYGYCPHEREIKSLVAV